MLVLPHAITSGASLYIEQEKLNAHKVGLFCVLALSLVFHAITLECSHFRKIPTVF